MESAWRLADFTPAARHASAKRILQLWQQTGDDDGAKPYLLALEPSHVLIKGSRSARMERVVAALENHFSHNEGATHAS